MSKKMELNALDQTMYMAECSSDQQMHCYIEFDGQIDANLFRNAIRQTIHLEKVLQYNLDRHFFNLYWKRIENNLESDILEIKKSNGDVDQEINWFMATKLDIRINPMLKILLLRAKAKDYLVFKAHHVLTDASGFVDYIRLVIRIYNKLTMDKTYVHPEYKAYHRTIQPVKDRYTKGERFKIMLSSTQVRAKDKVYSFPWNREEKEDHVYFVKHIISRKNAANIISYCEKHGFTLNDFLCAVYYKTYYTYRNELMNMETKYNPFFLTLDFRNYCRPKNNNALFNYSSGLMLQYYIDPNDEISSIIQQFGELTKELKIDFTHYANAKIPGLNTVLLLEKMLKVVPFELIFRGCYRVREGIGCVPGFGNAGKLETLVDKWEGVKVKNAYLTGGLGLCMGAFGFTSSSFYDEITFSMNFYGNPKNLEFVEEFFKRYDKICSDLMEEENKTSVYELEGFERSLF